MEGPRKQDEELGKYYWFPVSGTNTDTQTDGQEDKRTNEYKDTREEEKKVEY